MNNLLHDVAVIAPIRLHSKRLHEKALQMIGDRSMCEHVAECLRPLYHYTDHIYIATDSNIIAELVHKIGVKYIMTGQCISGIERVHMALQSLNKHNINYVINVQGDMPFIDSSAIIWFIDKLKTSACDIMTPVIELDNQSADNNSVVKVVIGSDDRAIYFSRSIIPNNFTGNLTNLWRHVGIYGFKNNVLHQLMHLPKTQLEEAEQLEQLRAIYYNIAIQVCYINKMILSVDTYNDLQLAKKFYHNNISNVL